MRGQWEVGCMVSGKTALGEKFHGEVYTFDEGIGLAVLRTPVRPFPSYMCKIIKH